MKPINIAVGTTSEQKIGYLKEVLNELHIKAALLPTEVDSSVPYQPMTSEATQEGSINRAQKALQMNHSADFAIGIEVGYHLNKENKYEMFSWASIVDKENNIVSYSSHRFILPKFHQDILKRNLYLGDYVREYFKRSEDTITQLVAEMVRGRRAFITTAIRHALIHYLKREEF